MYFWLQLYKNCSRIIHLAAGLSVPIRRSWFLRLGARTPSNGPVKLGPLGERGNKTPGTTAPSGS